MYVVLKYNDEILEDSSGYSKTYPKLKDAEAAIKENLDENGYNSDDTIDYEIFELKSVKKAVGIKNTGIQIVWEK